MGYCYLGMVLLGALLLVGLGGLGLGESRELHSSSTRYQYINNKIQSANTEYEYSGSASGALSEGGSGPSHAVPLKNILKGPADLGIYYINSAGVSCGGLKTNQCSSSCGALGYPVYWCYPKVCFCHYGNSQEEEQNGIDIQIPEF